MVFVPLKLGAHTVEQHRKVFLMVARKLLLLSAGREAPASVCLHVCLRDHIQAIDVTQAVNDRSVWIMAGADCIEIVLLEQFYILKHIFHSYVLLLFLFLALN
jgi:hypothetical protein